MVQNKKAVPQKESHQILPHLSTQHNKTPKLLSALGNAIAK